MKKIGSLLLFVVFFLVGPTGFSEAIGDTMTTQADYRMGEFVNQKDSTTMRFKRDILYNTPIDVQAGDKNMPGKDFIDVSSWNGDISVAQYTMMKNSYGIKGVVVKLTQDTDYINPYAQSQIRNAKAAGLVVSVYHFSVYKNNSEAIAEADFFASYAKSLGLDSGTILVNDAEHTNLLTGDVNATSKVFNKQVEKHGYNYVLMYVGRNWIDSRYIDPNEFGYGNLWVAQYPFVPSASSIWNSEFGAWQWSSQLYFPGISHPFDISMSFNDYFVKALSGSDIIAKETEVNTFGKIKSTPYNEFGNLPWGTQGYKKLGTLDQWFGQDAYVTKKVTTTSNNEYYQFQIGNSYYWTDFRNITLYDSIINEQPLTADGAVQYYEYSEYGSVPWGTKGYASKGVLKNYIGQTLPITKRIKTSGNNTYYEFQLDGQTYYADERNFKIKEYHSITSEKIVDGDATIQNYEYSEYGEVPWGTRGYVSRGVLKNYVGKTVQITKEVKTSGNNTYYEYQLNGKTYYADIRNFKAKWFDQIVSEKTVDMDATIKYYEYSEYGSVPWGTRGYISKGVLKDHIGQTVPITKEIKTSGNNTYYEFQLNGQTYYGDLRNFNLKSYHTIDSEQSIDEDATIVPFEYSEYGEVPWGTRGYASKGVLKAHQGKVVQLTKEVKTSGNNTYYEFQMDNKTLYADIRNFKIKHYNQIVSEKYADFDATVQYYEYSEYGEVPWGTRGYASKGVLKNYLGQVLSVTKEITTSDNNQYYEFQLNGQTYYGDIRNFKKKNYHSIDSEKDLDADGLIQYYEYSEYGEVPWGTRGYASKGILKNFIGQTVPISREVMTSGANTYYEFQLNGQTYFADVRNFKVKAYDSIIFETPVSISTKVKYYEYSEFGEVPWGTRGYVSKGILKNYLGQEVVLSKQIKTSGNNIYYEFQLNGKTYYADERNFSK